MVLIPNNQDLTASSGIINMAFLEAIYHSIIDEATIDLGRVVTFHLKPIVQQDNVTQSKSAPQQYNPFFGRVPVPNTNTRNSGTRITPRDVEYKAHIKVGPIKETDGGGMGDLLANEAVITVVAEALAHVLESISVSIEGRRYTLVGNPRPIGFTSRRYLMVKLREIQETEPPSPDSTIG